MKRYLRRKPAILAFGSFLVASVAAAAAYSPWTTWYHHGLIIGGIELIEMRSWLDQHALHDPYVTRPNGGITCGPETLTQRTADGTCNNLSEPSEGAAATRFGRNSQLSASFPGTEEELLTPNPRELSLELLTRKQFQPIPFLNMLAATWIQFMIHDWVSHNANTTVNPFVLPLSADDPSGQREMVILRTMPDPSRSDRDSQLPPTFENEVTHWWDGSQIYGSDLATQKFLRAGHDGLMRIDSSGNLPVDPADGVEIAGFKRNWWSGIAVMHTLFVLEHNSIAERLQAAHPDWSDEAIFQHARLVNAAVMAKIHTVEWTPAILPNPTLRQGMYANWFGFLNQDHDQVDLFLQFLKFNSVLEGIVGGQTNNHDVPFSLTEEFASVYRMHSLLPEAIDVHSATSGQLLEEIPVPAMRDSSSPAIVKRHGLTDWFYSLGTSHPGALTLGNYPNFMQSLNVPIVGQTDLGATDILRDRERGVPRYNEFRRQLNLKPIREFEDLTDDAAAVASLKRLYGGDVEKLDLMIGCLAEGHRPTSFGFGETQFQIFLLMASRRLQADRFYTASYTKDVYTQEGLDWIDQASLKTVLLRHFPGLAPALEGVDDAFNPWNAVSPPS